jgi:RHS repeat-associated protein
MNTAAAYKFDDTVPLQTATRLRVVTCVGYAANDDTYDNTNRLNEIITEGTQLPHPLPNPPPKGEGTNVAHRAAQTLEDANGNRTSLTDPDNKVTRYSFDELNRVSTVSNTGGTTSYAYDRSSLKTKVSYPNATTAATTYDRARRILTLVNRQGAAPVSSYSYTYDGNGNRTQQVENVTGTDETTNYAFDNNDRLTTVNYPDKQTAYTFDNNTNRLTEVTTESGVTTLDKVYTYNTRNQLTNVADNLNPANSAAYAFDANGNQTRKTQNGSTTNFTYDVKDQLLSVNQNNANIGVFSYDYQGHRIVKDMGGSIVRYAYDGSSVLVETDTSGSTLAKFDYGPDRLLSMNHISQGRAYYLFDALGSVANLTNTAGGIQARYQYDAYGNYRSTAGSSFNRFAFTGHEKDNETNLYYFKARFYDPETGRFLNQDAYLGDINTPPSLHRYLYAYANPTVYTDPSGHCVWDFCIAEIALGAVIVAEGRAIVDQLWGTQEEKDHVVERSIKEGISAVPTIALAAAGGAAVTGVKATIQTINAIGARQTAYAAANAVLGNPATATAVATEVVGTTAAVASGAVTPGSGLVTAESAAARTVAKEVNAISKSETIANSTQAATNLVTVEGDGLATAKTLAPTSKSVTAEPSVVAKAEAQGVGAAQASTGNAKRPGGYQTNDVDEHRLLSPQQNRAPGYENIPSDNMVQSHHAIQAEWASRNVQGYKRGDAPSVLLESSSGNAHAQVSAAQRQFRLERKQEGLDPFGTTIHEEFNIGYRQLIDAGVPENSARTVVKDSYKYFDSLGAFVK